MKKAGSIIVVAGLISSLLINSANAGSRHDDDFNPAWIPVAILTTVAAVAAFTQPPVVYERRVHHEPRQTVIYHEPQRHRPEHHFDRRPVHYRFTGDHHGERHHQQHR